MLIIEPTWDARIKIYGYEYIFITLFQLFQVFNRKFSENGSTRTFFLGEIICCITLFQLFQVFNRKFSENGSTRTFFLGKLSVVLLCSNCSRFLTESFLKTGERKLFFSGNYLRNLGKKKLFRMKS